MIRLAADVDVDALGARSRLLASFSRALATLGGLHGDLLVEPLDVLPQSVDLALGTHRILDPSMESLPQGTVVAIAGSVRRVVDLSCMISQSDEAARA